MGTIWSDGRSLSTEGLRKRVAQAATGLASLGVRAGDAVALYMRNDLAFFEAHAAAGQLGAYAVPINWHYGVDETAYLLRDCAAKALIIHADLYHRIKAAVPPGIVVLVVPTPPEIREACQLSTNEDPTPAGVIVWNDWIESFEPRTEPPLPAPDSMIYTSGTTGRPKGVRRAPPNPGQAEIMRAILSRCFGFEPYLSDPGRIITVVTGPMYHGAPLVFGTFAAAVGATVILQPRFDPEGLLALVEQRRVTHLYLVPIMFNRLLKLPQEVRERYDLSSLQFVVHSAAPCPPEVKRAMIAWLGPIIHEYYGSTEVGMVTFCTAEEWLEHPGTVGRPIPETQLRILGPSGEELPPNAVGEIGCKSWLSDFTYLGDPEKRREADRSGFVVPGDIGYLDDGGFLHLCDRSKDMLISGGVNIYPAEIEAELHQMPGVADCAVFGIPDEEYGESVCAAVELHAGGVLGEEDVKAFLRDRLAGYKVPRKVDFHPSLPREDSGKIFKRQLRELYWAGHGRRI